MSEKGTASASSGGIGFTGLLTIVFVIAKIMGYISWSWWVVFSPIWVTTLVVLAILLIGFIVIVLVEVLK